MKMSGPWRTTSQDLPLFEDLTMESEGQFNSLFTPFVTFNSCKVETGPQRTQTVSSNQTHVTEYRTGARYGGGEKEWGSRGSQARPNIKTYERKRKEIPCKNLEVLNNNKSIKTEPFIRIDVDVKKEVKVDVKEEKDDLASINNVMEKSSENEEVCGICNEVMYEKMKFKNHLRQCIDRNMPVVKSNEDVLKMVRGSLKCDDDEMKVSKYENNAHLDSIFMDDPDDVNESDNSLSDDEQVDARKLYPRRQIGNGNDHLDLEEYICIETTDEKYHEKVINSIEIMEKSCFGNLPNPESATMVDPSNFLENCNNCLKTFVRKKDFARHMYAHTFVKRPQDDEPVICSNCGKEFKNKTNWETHTNRTGCCGIPKTIFPCKVCDKTFTRKDNLRDHLKGHAGYRTRKRRSHKCPICGKVFGGEGMLSIHKKLHKKEENNIISATKVQDKSGQDFKCKDCGKCFPRKQRLILHELYVHHGLKPYPCSSCEKKYCRKEDLNRHVLVEHTGYPGSLEHAKKLSNSVQ